MSKLSFRARALDASKPMPIYMAEELPDLPDYSAINRAVPQMPSGMEKEEECEHHLQRAICAGLIIPTPEVSDIPNREFYDKVYPENYKQPRQLIHMQPFTMEQDIPDYDMDSEDERWLQSQTQKLELSPLKFEEMMDRLEKSSGQTVVTLNEAKILLKEDDDLIIAVFDYWLNKRLKTQHPLILTVKTEQRTGQAANNPYLAFRRRTEKMQTRKNRKNDETSYEKMLKLRRDLYRAVQLLELIKKREKVKREFVNMTIEIFDKRYQMKDFNGAVYAEATSVILNNSNKQGLTGQTIGIGGITRPAFTPIFHNHYTNQNWNKSIIKDELLQRKEKRQYKKRKHKSFSGHLNRTIDSYCGSGGIGTGGGSGGISSDDDLTQSQLSPESDDIMEDEGQFAFRRNKLCSYHMPLSKEGNWPWCSLDENGLADKRFRFTLTSLSNPKRCIGFARRRMGRGGRIILDRYSTNNDDFWRTLDFSIYEPNTTDNLINNKTNDSVVINNNLKTDYKNDLSSNFNNSVNNNNNNIVRTNIVSDFNSKSESDVKIEIKKEIVDNDNIIDNNIKIDECNNDTDDMVEFLRSLRRDWLHFRPKTPPSDYEPTNDMLLQSDNLLFCANNSPPSCFSMEIQPLDTDSNPLLSDTSIFLTDPFLFEQNFDNLIDVPITDTRQQQQQQQQQSSSNDKIIQIINNNNNNNNTLNNINNDSKKLFDESCNSTRKLNDDDNNKIVGCSKFFLSDINSNNCSGIGDVVVGVGGRRGDEKDKTMLKQKNYTYTLTSPKFNNYFISDNKIKSNNNNNNNNNDSAVTNTNGLLPQFGFDVNSGRTKTNKLYAYNTSGMDYSNASSGTLSLHTSAHTLTLNSHSANLLEIPIANDAEAVTTKLVTTGGESGTTTPNNNKTKTIVRKNNLVMEVT